MKKDRDSVGGECGDGGALLAPWRALSAFSISEIDPFYAPLPRQPPVLSWAEQEVIVPAPWEAVSYILFYQISLGNFMNYELSTPFSTAIEWAS